MNKNQRAQRVVRTETVTMEEPKCYLVTRTDRPDFTGNEKFVQFRDGRGVLDVACIHRERPDWVENVAGELIQKTGNSLSSYVEWWERRNALVEEITAEQAAEFRAWLERETRSDQDRAAAAMRAKQGAKSKNREGSQLEQQLMAAARAALPVVSMPAWANPKQAEADTATMKPPAPHETGATASAIPDAVPPHLSGEMSGAPTEDAPAVTTTIGEDPATGGGGTNNG